MDALSDVLRVSRLTGGVFLHANFTAPWCMAAHIPVEHCGPYLGPASHLITYHYVIEGELRLRMTGGDDDQSHVLGPGDAVMMPRNEPHLFVEAVRHYAEALPKGRTGWLAGLCDPYVSRALALFHSDVARPWTVDALGREIGLARSALTDRFTRLIGVAPMHYLANWRMQIAAQKLRDTSASLAQVADAVGYDSEAAFSRAFKKAFGAAPATWRRSNRPPT